MTPPWTPPSPQPTIVRCGETSWANDWTTPDIIRGVTSLCCLLSAIAFISYAPHALVDVYIGKNGLAKSGIMLGLMTSFVVSSFLNRIVLDGKDSDWLQTIGAVCVFLSRCWMCLLFQHTLSVLQLPKREGDIASLTADARKFLILLVSGMIVFSGLSLFLAVVGCSVNAIIDPTGWSALYTIMAPAAVVYALVAMFEFRVIILTLLEARGRLLGVSGKRIVLCAVGEAASFGVFLFLIPGLIEQWSGYGELLSTEHSRAFYQECIRHFTAHFVVLPWGISTTAAILSLFPVSAKKLCGSVAHIMKLFARFLSNKGVEIDEVLEMCLMRRSSPFSKEERTVIEEWALKANDDFDFALVFGETAAGTGATRGIVHGGDETMIMREVGAAAFVEDADTFSLVIPPEFISIRERPIAAGGFGQVHSGVFAGKKVAVKKVFNQQLTGDLQEFIHEVRILNNLRGVPHVLMLHGVSLQMNQGQRMYLMVLEWCPVSLHDLIHSSATPDQAQPRRTASTASQGDELLRSGSLSQRLLEREQSLHIHSAQFDPNAFLQTTRQLANALHVLHYKGYCHRDLKPQNILFANPEDLGTSLRICDFGSARIVDTQTGLCSIQGGDLNGISPLYTPPEVAAGLISGGDVDYDGRAFDIYSLGVIMWECWQHHHPEYSVAHGGGPARSTIPLTTSSQLAFSPQLADVLQKTIRGLRPDAMLSTGPFGSPPRIIADLMTRMWQPDPTLRPDAAGIKVSVDSADTQLSINEKQEAWTRGSKRSRGGVQDPCSRGSLAVAARGPNSVSFSDA